MHMADSLHRTAEINTALSSSYIPVLFFFSHGVSIIENSLTILSMGLQKTLNNKIKAFCQASFVPLGVRKEYIFTLDCELRGSKSLCALEFQSLGRPWCRESSHSGGDSEHVPKVKHSRLDSYPGLSKVAQWNDMAVYNQRTLPSCDQPKGEVTMKK